MEISNTMVLFMAMGTQVLTALGLFWSITSSFHKEINEVKVEQAKIEGRLNVLDQRLTSLEQTVRYILDCFPKPRLAIQNPQDTQD